ncbi:hypothetical protein GX645_05855 [Candidatus Sumerlaeota bacterium]|nr:hypothetical protein [Candidatus Sumerlaeota bacterium]
MLKKTTILWLSLIFLCVGQEMMCYAQNNNANQQKSSSSRRRSLSNSGSNLSNNSRNSNNSSTNAFSSNSSSERLKKRQEEAKKRAEEKKKAKEEKGKKSDSKNKDQAKTGGQGQVTTTAKKTNAPSSGGGTNTGSTTLNAFNIKPNLSNNLLYVELVSSQPTLDIVVRKGDTFATRIVFRDGGMEEFDSIDVSLKYDPRLIEPVGIDDTAFSSRLLEPALARVDRVKGIIAWHAKFSSPIITNSSEVFRVSWKAIALTDKTSLSFMNTPDFPSRVLCGKRNILLPMVQEGAELGDEDLTEGIIGLLAADISIVTDLVTNDAAGETSSGTVVTTVGSSTYKLARDIAEGTAEGRVYLGMKSSTQSPVLGQDFVVTIYYENPNMVDFDRVRLTIDFDPKVLNVVDWDTDNWITQDINIYDGEFRDELPYDMHLKNSALNNVGRIFYEMGFSHRPSPAERGVLARIRFKPLKTSALTRINFDYSDSEEFVSPTALSFLGYNLIGVPDQRKGYYGQLLLPVTDSSQH